MSFTTFDVDNDRYVEDDRWDGNFAIRFAGAWWYQKCHESNFNGLYQGGPYNTTEANGVCWKSWFGYMYSLKMTEMKIRRK